MEVFHMAILHRDSQIQPLWPPRLDQFHGPYASVSSPAESIRQDFVFLLQTIPGEWPMNPDLGIGIITYVFENFQALEASDIKSNIENQLRKYLSSVSLINAEFISTPDEVDNYSSILRITYAIPDFGVEEELDFGLNEVEKTMMPMLGARNKTRID
jgi:phage baseplate assembly protein W